MERTYKNKTETEREGGFRMIKLILEWLGTALILIGISLLASKKASKPKIRIYGLTLSLIGCSSLGIFGILIGAFGIAVTQLGVILLDIWGINNCIHEIKVSRDE